ncbi:Imm53 family immunity protein [Kribbella qitaiheensis]|uniref:Imm53 family immunity protein n=1 Tax=Kribbella qitaiheensis TaxID=1544730 RepID=UPI003606B47D
MALSPLDNPGWVLDVRIEDTELEGVVVDWHKIDDSEQSWIYWRSTGSMFEARCGSGDLTRALDAFREFVRTHWGFGHPDSERQRVDGFGGRD